ncbi:MAG TPA: glycosyltransferase, partial [candidate division Zixibacteria bacterium]|nr:glycosyltransferase [candidate division Zixibacteria bacterium]
MTSTMPRIGYVLNTYPRLSETFILQEILELERRGVDVTIFSLKRPDEGKFHPGVVRVKAAVQYLDTLKPQRWWRWLQEEWETVQPHLPGLWRVIEEVVPMAAGATMDEVFLGMMVGSRARALGLDALHAHFANTSCNVAHFAHRTTGIPYSFTAHAKDIFTDTVDHAFLARKISDSRFMITVSEYNRQYLEEACPDADLSKIRVLYNGINLDFFAPGPVADSRSESLILGVGRLVAKKGFADLIRACGILRDRGLGFTCRIIGKGREEPRLNQLIAELNLTERVTL